MKAKEKKMRLLPRIIFLMFLISGFAFSQNKNSQSSQHKNYYLVFDVSKSLQGNELIDHLQFLISNSENVELPAKTIKMLDDIQGDDPQIHDKLNYMRASILKVLYNERISPADKEFICNHYLNDSYTNDYRYIPIISTLRTYMDKGHL